MNDTVSSERLTLIDPPIEEGLVGDVPAFAPPVQASLAVEASASAVDPVGGPASEAVVEPQQPVADQSAVSAAAASGEPVEASADAGPAGEGNEAVVSTSVAEGGAGPVAADQSAQAEAGGEVAVSAGPGEASSAPPGVVGESGEATPLAAADGAAGAPEALAAAPAEPQASADGASELGSGLAASAMPESASAVTLEDQLRMLAAKVLAERGVDPSQPQARLSEGEVRRISQHLSGVGAPMPVSPAPGTVSTLASVPGHAVASEPVTLGQQAQMKGGAALVEGVGALVGGAVGLVGAAGKAVGGAAQSLADAVRAGAANKGAAAPGAAAEMTGGSPAVLPRLSEYRIGQVEKAAATFGSEADAFWQSSPKLTALRDEMGRIAREKGLSVQDVAQQMRPGGELADLRKQFNEAVAESPDATARRKAMDRAMDSYVRQWGRAQEEVLNPEQEGSPHFDRHRDRLTQAQQDMEAKAGGIPAFANDKGVLEPSHLERLREAVARIIEKLKEVAQEFMQMIRGRGPEKNDGPGL